MHSLLLAASSNPAQVSTGEAIAFWILGPVALLGAIGMVLLRNAVHSALSLVATMMCLGLFYLIEQGPFLGLVQIIVYTGAIMILFLFVLMLVGRDSSDSLVETLRGQRVAAILAGLAFALLLASDHRPRLQGPDRAQPGRGQRQRRQRQFDRDAAVHQVPVRLRTHLGAADRGRRGCHGAGPHRTGRGQAVAEGDGPRADPLRPAAAAARPGRASSGNAIGTPALLPDGSIARESLLGGEAINVGAPDALPGRNGGL